MSDHTYNLANKFYSDAMQARLEKPHLSKLFDDLYDAQQKAKQCKCMLSPRRKDHEVWEARYQEALTKVKAAEQALKAYEASDVEAA